MTSHTEIYFDYPHLIKSKHKTPTSMNKIFSGYRLPKLNNKSILMVSGIIGVQNGTHFTVINEQCKLYETEVETAVNHIN